MVGLLAQMGSTESMELMERTVQTVLGEVEVGDHVLISSVILSRSQDRTLILRFSIVSPFTLHPQPNLPYSPIANISLTRRIVGSGGTHATQPTRGVPAQQMRLRDGRDPEEHRLQVRPLAGQRADAKGAGNGRHQAA